MFAWFDSKRQRVRMEEKEEPIRGVAVVPVYQTLTKDCHGC